MRARPSTLSRRIVGALALTACGLCVLALVAFGDAFASGVAVACVPAIRRRKPLRARLASEQSGFALLEVVVGAALVLVVGTAVLKGIDGSQRTSRENRARSVAAELAQQDQERLRAFKVTELSNYHEVRNVTPGGDPSAGGPFRVESRATWVRDNSGTVNCTNDSTQANYLQITSTVTWADMSPLKPVTATSLVAPPAGAFGPNDGTLAIQVLGARSQPIQGVTVTLTGPDSLSDVTDANGCVVFGYIDAGTYQATLSKPGYVDPSGDADSQHTVAVIGGATTLQQYLYDLAATVHIGFDTVKAGVTAPGQAYTAASLSSGSLPAPFYRAFTRSPAATTIDAANVFPIAGGYSVYAGSCGANDPLNVPDGYDKGFVVRVNPGPGDDVSATARVPSLSLAVKYQSSGANVASGTVKITPPSGCGSPFTLPIGAGAVETALPFGAYTVCAYDGTRNSGKVTVVNYDPNGSAATLTIPSSGNTGGCP